MKQTLYRVFSVKMVMTKMKELTYEQRLEIVFYHNNGKNYDKLLNITGHLKSDAVDALHKILGKIALLPMNKFFY